MLVTMPGGFLHNQGTTRGEGRHEHALQVGHRGHAGARGLDRPFDVPRSEQLRMGAFKHSLVWLAAQVERSPEAKQQTATRHLRL